MTGCWSNIGNREECCGGFLFLWLMEMKINIAVVVVVLMGD